VLGMQVEVGHWGLAVWAGAAVLAGVVELAGAMWWCRVSAGLAVLVADGCRASGLMRGGVRRLVLLGVCCACLAGCGRRVIHVASSQ
jgi:hypothetical protein